ncbi:galactose-3-O-sulfotransferase 3 [Periophthalmus magnuspinnatus]|uniref:galactose-3-O-sulfotransferase 3 n=1 Tax=Periophthalmus magnuspinnatus TaxID=409849 RepID=UPI00145BBB64|nr:galactose-3-O-sulfotransferase 3 [Periophthalmus magnuspinnatus]XP_055085010.1 galactose-3-O-sulfotransferase 3 [Periophthalmus magnuspinnatus]XP_055085011.1 galactose-3-O-sulfotransferase 3 [Periophthalmus magnuspinnatus]
MWQKKIFLFFVIISTVSLLLHQGGHWNWNIKSFHFGCRAVPRGPRSKITSVVFLKTHKTASSTMQNLLFRFAERHNLTVALPVPACGHQFCYPRTFTSHFVHPHTLPPNIITNHMRFNKAELQRLMPTNTTYITIMREPSSMFESLFVYYSQYCQSFKRVANVSLEAFLDNPWRYYRAEEKDSMYARNTLTFDLGGDKDRPATDEAYAKSFTAQVEQRFSLVMISEYFDESLILLRHLLNWDLEDIVYFKLNMRTESSKQSLNPQLSAKIRAWNSVDAHLFDHFNASLWRQLSALGLDCVAREVQLLRQAQEKLMRTCFAGQTPLRSAAQIKNKDLRPWQPNGKVDIVGYELPSNISVGAWTPPDVCLKLIMPEIQYTKVLLRSQSIRYRRSYQYRAHLPQKAVRTVVVRHPQIHRIEPKPAVVPAPVTKTTSSPKTSGTQSQSAMQEPH